MANYVATYKDFNARPVIITHYLGEPLDDWYEVDTDELIMYKVNTKSHSIIKVEYAGDMVCTGGRSQYCRSIDIWRRHKISV